MVVLGLFATGCAILAENQIPSNMPQKSVLVMSMLETSTNLQKYILEHKNVVLLFYGEHCPPCERFKPIFRDLANSDEFADTVVFIEVSAIEYASIRRIYGVNKWPTVIFFKSGREVRRDVRRDDLSFISAATFRQHVLDLVNMQG